MISFVLLKDYIDFQGKYRMDGRLLGSQMQKQSRFSLILGKERNQTYLIRKSTRFPVGLAVEIKGKTQRLRKLTEE